MYKPLCNPASMFPNSFPFDSPSVLCVYIYIYRQIQYFAFRSESFKAIRALKILSPRMPVFSPYTAGSASVARGMPRWLSLSPRSLCLWGEKNSVVEKGHTPKP